MPPPPSPPSFVARMLVWRTWVMLVLVLVCGGVNGAWWNEHAYDTSAEHVVGSSSSAMAASPAAFTSHGVLTRVLVAPLARLHHWDALHLQRIAVAGYQHEKQHAFWPLLPLVQRALRASIAAIAGETHVDLVWPIASFVWSACCFAVAAFAFARLTELVFDDATARELRDPRATSIVRSATVFFVCNPANIFFTAPYTESLFAAASFVGMCEWMHRRYITACLCFMVASLTRSNGILLCALPIARAAQECVSIVLVEMERGKPKRTSVTLVARSAAFAVVRSIFIAAVQCVVIVTPYVAFSWWSARKYCTGVGDDDDHASAPPYCSDRWWLPTIYSYIQATYWNVGFLRYYRVEQLPNFVLAAPAWAFVLVALCAFATMLVEEYREGGGGLMLLLSRVAGEDGGRDVATSSAGARGPGGGGRGRGHRIDRIAPFMVHLALAFAVCVGIMHVQVSTRFLFSASPVLPWAMAWWCHDSPSASPLRLAPSRLFYTAAWCAGYTLIGTTLFTAFLPWT